MPRADKTLDRMRANPRDWRIASLEAVAAAHGVNVRKSGGSHVVFEHAAVADALSVPARRPIKPVYVRGGETMGGPVVKGQDAKACWIAAMTPAGRPVPPPSAGPAEPYSGKW